MIRNGNMQNQILTDKAAILFYIPSFSKLYLSEHQL